MEALTETAIHQCLLLSLNNAGIVMNRKFKCHGLQHFQKSTITIVPFMQYLNFNIGLYQIVIRILSSYTMTTILLGGKSRE